MIMMTKKFGFDLDLDFEDLWYELEKIQDGDLAHVITVNACDKTNAAIELTNRLVPFFAKKIFELEDSPGRKYNVDSD